MKKELTLPFFKIIENRGRTDQKFQIDQQQRRYGMLNFNVFRAFIENNRYRR